MIRCPAESPHLKSAIEQQKLKFLALNNQPKREGSEGGTVTGKHEGRKGRHEDKAGSSRDREADAEGNGPMNKSSVGESMQELKRMHLISPSVSAPATDSKGSANRPKKVSYLILSC